MGFNPDKHTVQTVADWLTETPFPILSTCTVIAATMERVAERVRFNDWTESRNLGGAVTRVMPFL